MTYKYDGKKYDNIQDYIQKELSPEERKQFKNIIGEVLQREETISENSKKTKENLEKFATSQIKLLKGIEGLSTQVNKLKESTGRTFKVITDVMERQNNVIDEYQKREAYRELQKANQEEGEGTFIH